MATMESCLASIESCVVCGEYRNLIVFGEYRNVVMSVVSIEMLCCLW